MYGRKSPDLLLANDELTQHAFVAPKRSEGGSPVVEPRRPARRNKPPPALNVYRVEPLFLARQRPGVRRPSGAFCHLPFFSALCARSKPVLPLPSFSSLLSLPKSQISNPKSAPLAASKVLLMLAKVCSTVVNVVERQPGRHPHRHFQVPMAPSGGF